MNMHTPQAAAQTLALRLSRAGYCWRLAKIKAKAEGVTIDALQSAAEAANIAFLGMPRKQEDGL